MTSGHERLLFLLFQSFTPLYFAAPACFYLYITGFIHSRQSMTKIELLHFLPAALAIIHILPWPGVPTPDWNLIASQLSENGYHSLRIKSGLFPASFHYILRPVLILSYLVLCWHAIINSQIDGKPCINTSGRNWITFLLKTATFFQVTGLIPILIRNLNIPLYNSFFITLNCIVLLSILLYALHRPEIFYGHLLVAIEWDNKDLSKRVLMPEVNAASAVLPLKIKDETETKLRLNNRFNLSSEQTSLYAVLIKDVMESEQLYLQADLQIIDLANKIKIPVHHCSHIVNNHIGKNFRAWINSYRIAHFLTRYPMQRDKITIEAIAQESGFKSQATFYNAFKKEKGIMPTTYLAQGPSGKVTMGDFV